MNIVAFWPAKLLVSCAVFDGVQQCAGNVLYPLVHRTFQFHIYRIDADMFGESRLAVRRIVEEGLPTFAVGTRYDEVPLEGLTSR